MLNWKKYGNKIGISKIKCWSYLDDFKRRLNLRSINGIRRFVK